MPKASSRIIGRKAVSHEVDTGISAERQTRRQFLKAAALGTAVAACATASSSACRRIPYVQQVSSTEAHILWTLPSKSDAVLEVIDEAGVARTIVPEVTEFSAGKTGMAEGYYQYLARVPQLREDASYSYAVQNAGASRGTPLAGPSRFRTSARAKAFSFLHIADSGTGSDAQLSLAQQMAKEDAHLVLANGDLAYDDATYQSVESTYYGVYGAMMARIPFFATLGNHEYYTENGAPALAARTSPTEGVPAEDAGRYYSFDWGNAHFVALDSNEPLLRVDSGNRSMIDWLENDLRATRKFWRIAFFHHPPYATGKHERSREGALAREAIVPILERYGVQLVLNGHEHSYQRTLPLLGGLPSGNGIVYITSGGGGQEMYESPAADWIAERRAVNHYLRAQVAGASLRVAAITADGSATDQTLLAPRPSLTGQFLDGAGFSANVAAGGLATLFGRNLAHNGRPEDVSIRLGGHEIPALYADANQLNVQLPFTFTGAGELEVHTPNGAVRLTVKVTPASPVIFTDAEGFAVAEHADGRLVSEKEPVAPGEVVTVMLTGLGAVKGTPVAGTVPAKALPVAATVSARVGDREAEVVDCVLGTKLAGVYELRVKVPAGGGALRVLAHDALSPAARLHI